MYITKTLDASTFNPVIAGEQKELLHGLLVEIKKKRSRFTFLHCKERYLKASATEYGTLIDFFEGVIAGV